MTENQHQVYFDRIASEFNSHYKSQKAWWVSALDQVFRQGMAQRFRYLTESMEWQGQCVLDVGCGPGHYMAALVGKGAKEVVGIDFAPSMVALAKRNLEARRVDARCSVILGDFLEMRFDQAFDSVVAIGYFDYLIGRRAVEQHLGRMLAVAGRQVVASFPYRWSFKTFPRWVWLRFRGCPVQFYSMGDVTELMRRAGVLRFHIERMSGTVLVIAEKP